MYNYALIIPKNWQKVKRYVKKYAKTFIFMQNIGDMGKRGNVFGKIIYKTALCLNIDKLIKDVYNK